MVKTMLSDEFIDYLISINIDQNIKFCYILGSGCSVENGISTGWQLAKKWYDQLNLIYTRKEIEHWKQEEHIDVNDLGFAYSKVFKFRFAKDPDEGYKAINFEIEKGRTGFGHIIFTQLLLKTKSNVVITTNFDTLIEETLYTFSDIRPIICGHESIARFARPSAERPLIIKIHRDRFMDPLNLDDEIAMLKPEWSGILNQIFSEYIPVFIGYGGNDGSLMGYLNNLIPCSNMFWCTTSSHPLRPDIQNTIAHHNGTIVHIEGFNRLMLRLMPVYNISSVQDIVLNKAKRLEEKYLDSLINLSIRINSEGTQTEKNQIIDVINQFNETDWWYWEMKVEAAKSLSEKESLYLRGLKLLPKSAQLNYNYGDFLFDRKDYKGAIKYLSKTIKLNETNADAWYNMGLAYRNLLDYNRAITCYRKTVEIKSTHSVAWNSMGVCYHSKANYQEAIACYKRSLSATPNKANTWNNLGFTYKVTGMSLDALKCYKKAVKLDPLLAKVYFNIANIYYDKKEFKKAIRYYKKSISIDAQDADTFYNLGLAYEDVNQNNEAKAYFGKAHLLDPNDPDFKKRYDLIFKK